MRGYKFAKFKLAHYNCFMFKKILFLLSLLLLTSCAQFEADVKINYRLPSTYEGCFYLSQNLLSDNESTWELFNNNMPSVTFSNIEKESIIYNDEIYDGFCFSGNIEDLSEFITVEREAETVTLTIKSSQLENLPLGDLFGSNFELSQLKDYGVVANLNISMPATIISANQGEYSGSKITVDLLDTNYDDVIVVSKASPILLIINFIITLIVLVILLVILLKLFYRYLKRSHKKNKQTK